MMDKEEVNLSIEETNKLRTELGLPPLKIESSEQKEAREKKEQDAVNQLSEERRSDQIRDDIRKRREQRQYKDRISGKSLGDQIKSEVANQSANDWVNRQKQMSLKLAKELEEKDKEDSEYISQKYTSSSLRGMKVRHDLGEFEDGQEIILTLKDDYIIKDATLNEGEDELESIDLVAKETTSKNIELKKALPGIYDVYNQHDDGILTKYDDEKQSSMRLDTSGTIRKENFQLSEEERIRQNLKSQETQHYDLGSINTKFQSDYFTQEEMSLKFGKKKTKKSKKKNIRKHAVNLDFLENSSTQEGPSDDHGSRGSIKKNIDLVEKIVTGHEKFDKALEKAEMNAPADLFDTKKEKKVDENESDNEDIELQVSIERARRQSKQNKKNYIDPAALVKQQLEQAKIDSIELGNGVGEVMNLTTEFCRGMKQEKEEVVKPEKKLEKIEKENEIEKGSYEVNESEDEDDTNEYDINTISGAPQINRGLAGALQAIKKQGFVSTKTAAYTQGIAAPSSKWSELSGRSNDIRGEKVYEQMLAKAGMTGKEGGVKLEHLDEHGRQMTKKEAFRHMSRIFHKKYSGKTKLEKVMKKNQRANSSKKMSSSDTPLGMVEKFQATTKKTGRAYIEWTDKQVNLGNPGKTFIEAPKKKKKLE